jgi:DNA-binding PadR family transcriptional regulator
MYGYEIIQELSEFNLNTAILYPTLKKLEDMGLIRSFYSPQSRGVKKRKNYELTEKGITFLHNLFDFKQVPEYYMELSIEETKYFKKHMIGKDCLVIEYTNFIDLDAFLNSKTLFNNRVPNNIEIMRLYDFKNNNTLDPKDIIVLGFPFFIHYDIKDSLIDDSIKNFKKVRQTLKDDGELWVLDLYWERNAVIDVFSYLVTGKIKRMVFQWEEMQSILAKASFSNFNLMKKDSGIILFSCS